MLNVMFIKNEIILMSNWMFVGECGRARLEAIIQSNQRTVWVLDYVLFYYVQMVCT